jgi:general secretion pathway protein D
MRTVLGLHLRVTASVLGRIVVAFGTGAAACVLLPVAAQARQPAPAAAQVAAPAPTAPSSAAASGTEEPVTLNFVNADVEAVVRAIGQYTGRSFVIDPRVKGTMTLVTEHPVTRRQAYEELQSALRLQGFTLVESPEPGGVARVLLEADAKLQGGRVLGGGSTARGDQVVTQVFRLQYESATNLVPVLRPLIAPNNTIAAYAANNTLVITDYADNLRRLARIIEDIDSPATSDVIVVPMKYGLATDIAGIVSRVLDDAARSTGQSSDSGQRVLVQAESRSNSIILKAASRARLEQAKMLIDHFDQPSATPGNINVIYLRNAQALKLAPLLRAVLASDPNFVAQVGSGTSLSGGSFGGGSSGSGLGGSSSSFGSSGGFGSSNTSGNSGVFGSSSSGAGGASLGSSSGNSAGTSAASYSGSGSSTGGGNDKSGLAGMIQADPSTNSLIISAPEPLFRNIRAIVDKLDVRPAQVLIESLVVELSGDNASEFGIQWQSLTGLNNSGTSTIGGTNFGSTGQNILTTSESLGTIGQGLNIGVLKGTVNIPGIGSVTNIGLLARALETQANANILSRPNIQTLDNEEGKFLVGQNIGLVTGSYANTGTTTTTTATSSGTTVTPFQTYDRHDVGLQLRIKPQISEGGSVRLSIYIEDSSVATGTDVTNPTLNKRSFETSVIVEDGNFVVISGMIQDTVNVNQYKVPLLGDIPVLGYLFRYDSREHIKTQTMVFLRPTVIRDEASSRAAAVDRYDYIRNEMEQNAPEHHLILKDMAIPMPPLPPQPNAPAPAAGTTIGLAEQRIVVAVVETEDQAQQVMRQVKGVGMSSHVETQAPPANATGGSATTRLRVVIDKSPTGTDETLAILRALGYSPGTESLGAAAPAPKP